MTDVLRSPWMATAFWVVTSVELLWQLSWFVTFAIRGGRGQYAGLELIVRGVIALGFAAFMVGFALVHNPVLRAIALAAVVWPALSLGFTSARDWARTPSTESLVAGSGYFKQPADRALAAAIVAGDARKVAELVPAANIKAIGFDTMTFLRLALRDQTMCEGRPDPAIVVALLNAGADPDQGDLLFGAFDSSNEHNLMMGQNNEPLLRAVLDSGIDLNHLDGRGRPRFFEAFQWPEALTLMLSHGANIEAEDTDGNTALMVAVKYGIWPAVEVLLAHGARLDHVAHDGRGLRDLVNDNLKLLGEHASSELKALDQRLH